MNERQMQFRVGVVVFATMIIGGLLATLNEPFLSGWLPWGVSKYEVGIELPRAPGVAPNTPVRKNGILIGRVSDIQDQTEGVLLKAEIDGNRSLFAQHQPHVRTTVLGDATVEFQIDQPVPAGAQPVPDGFIFKNGQVDDNPLESLAKLGDLREEFASASQALTVAGEEVAKLANRINTAFGDETEQGRVGRLMDTTENAMNQFAATMTAFNEIIGDVPLDTQQPVDTRRFEGQPPFDPQQPVDVPPPVGVPPTGEQPPMEGRELRLRLRQGLSELPDAIREFRQTLELADRNLRNLEGFTEPLGQKGEAISDAMIRAVEGIDRLIEDFNVLVQALNNREGTIGRLIHDPQAYENLNRLMCNANQVLGQFYELTKRLRPVVEDARVLMDKVAREPGRVVTGGLNPSAIK
jgi:phospholipid/cholesterol/gamma-HCH transport system substrate-binding protein